MKPGAKHIIAKMAKEEEAQRGKTYTFGHWVYDNIGDVSKWEDDNNRGLDTYKKEADAGFRKKLTRWSNIAAFYGDPGEFSEEDETSFIENDIGGLVGSVEASWLAATTMRIIGAYASEGYVALPSGKSHLPLGEGRFISGDDTGKFYAYMFNMKEGLKGRTSGLKDMIGKIPDTAMNLFDWAQVKVEVPDGEGGTKTVRRSIWDAWLGTAGGKQKTDFLTGEKTNNLTTEEGYHRLGDLRYKSLDREFHGTFAIMQWLLGNGDKPTGVFIEALKTEFKDDEFELNELKKKRKYIGITFNSTLLTKGSEHLYTYKTDPETGKESSQYTTAIIAKNLFRNLMYARIHSSYFTKKFLNSTTKLFHPRTAAAEVPNPVMVGAYIKEALKSNPTNEEELKAHYIDENRQLINMGSSHTHGLPEDVVALVDAKFEPEDINEKKLIGYVGKVTGKKF